MALYGILKKYIGEWLDLFVILLIYISYYLGLLKVEVLYLSVEILCFFYLYKIYYIIFIRIYDKSKKYRFTWDLDKECLRKFLKEKKWFVYVINILCIIMPWNLF